MKHTTTFKEYLRLFPHGEGVIREFHKHIIHPKVWGYWDGHVKHANTYAQLDRGWGNKLSQRRLQEHFIHRDQPVFVWYTNKGCLDIDDGMRYLYLMFDIDNKLKSTNDCDDIKSDIEKLLDVEFYSNPSTNGHGLHCYCMIGFPMDWDARKINNSISELTKNVKRLLSNNTCCKFDRINGGMNDDLRHGSLAKVPSPRDDADMVRLEASLKRKHNILNINVRLSGGSSLDTTEEKSDTFDGRFVSETQVEVSTTAKTKKRSDTFVGRFSLEGIQAIEDTLVRRREYAYHLGRRMGRVPSVEELMTGYARDIDTGVVSEHRLADFGRIHSYMLKHFKDGACVWETDYAQALKIINSRNIDAVVCDEMYGKKNNGSRLRVEDVAVVYAMMLNNSRKSHGKVAMTGKCVFKRSQALKKSGKIKRTIDFKKYGTCKAIMEMFGLICQEGKPIKGVTATPYIVVKQPEALPEGLQCPRTHAEAEGVVTEGVEGREALASLSPRKDGSSHPKHSEECHTSSTEPTQEPHPRASHHPRIPLQCKQECH